MENKLMEWILLLTLILGGCAQPYPIASNQALALQAKYTMDNVQAVLLGANPLAQAYADGKGLYFLTWPGPGNMWSGACLQLRCPDWMGQFKYFAGGQGTTMTPEGIGNLVRGLITAGWYKVVPGGIVNPGLVTPAVFPLFPELLPEGIPQS